MSILGKGWDFPYEFKRGRLGTAEGDESVEAAVRMLFQTPKGKRAMLPEYGSDLPSLVFEPLDESTASLAELYTKEAIRDWIPRIKRVKVRSQVDRERHALVLNITYTTINDPTPRTMVYPFYLDADNPNS